MSHFSASQPSYTATIGRRKNRKKLLSMKKIQTLFLNCLYTAAVYFSVSSLLNLDLRTRAIDQVDSVRIKDFSFKT